MKRLYVSGPMFGYDELNYPEFNRVTKLLRSIGYQVLNPVEVDPELDKIDDLPWQEFLWSDMKAICEFKPDGIVMLDGWRKSRGACIEHAFLEAMNCAVIPLDQMQRYLIDERHVKW